jgi:hypothetical protein
MVVTALAGAVIAGLSCVAQAPAAVADVLPVHVSLDSMTPAVARSGDTLRITGRLLSSALEPLTEVSVHLRRSRTPVATRTDLAAALATPDAALGSDAVDVPGSDVTVGSSLAPGAAVPFSITVPVSRLRLVGSGSWILGIEVLSSRGGGSPTPVGEQRTVLPSYAEAPEPIDITWLWPLVDWPARTANGALLNDTTPIELSPDGRLDQALSAAEQNASAVSWVVDPALLQTARDMSDGYQVLVDGSPTLGDRPRAARDWLKRLTRLTRDATVHPLPYADVDASALVRGGLPGDVVRAVTQGPVVARESSSLTFGGTIAWSPYGRLDATSADVLATSGVTALVLPADSLPTTDPVSGATTAIQTPHGSITGVLVDPRLSALTDPRQAADPILLRQEFLADTALIAAGMSDLRADRGLVIAPQSVTWTPEVKALAPLLAALDSTPWLRSRSLQDLLAIRPDGAMRGRAPYGSRARAAEIPGTYVARIARTSGQVSALTAIVDAPTDLGEPYRQALLRSSSATWRTEPEVGSTLLATTSRSVTAQIGQVHVLSAGTITLSGDAGRVPITIANESEHDVVVGVVVRGNPSVRLRSTPLSGIRIPAGQKASIDITAQVVGADAVPADIQLLTPEGQDYGQPARISVTSTAYARAASWVMIAAFVAILVFVVFGVVRRIRARAPREVEE